MYQSRPNKVRAGTCTFISTNVPHVSARIWTQFHHPRILGHFDSQYLKVRSRRADLLTLHQKSTNFTELAPDIGCRFTSDI